MNENALFIGFSINNYNRLLETGFKFIWIPVALLQVPKCQPKKMFIVDCCFHAIANSVLLRLILIKSLKKNKIMLHSTSNVNVPLLKRLRCSPQDFIKDLKELKKSIDESAILFSSFKNSWVECIEPWRIFLSHVLSPTEKIIGPLEKMPLTLSRSIIRSLIEDMLVQLCIDNLSVENIKWDLAYLMLALKEAERRAMLLVGDKLIASEAYARNIFENENIYNLIINTLYKSNSKKH